MSKEKITFRESSGNVFADFGLEDADDLMAKAELVLAVRNRIEQRDLTQTQAAEHRRQKSLAECDAAYAALRRDPEAWAGYQAELAAWEVTLTDGLDPDEAEAQEKPTG